MQKILFQGHFELFCPKLGTPEITQKTWQSFFSIYAILSCTM